ncbi:DDE_3 domain-containing protein [Trichonephila clavipes]|uniref:DDE_3 domain-containing protein n=1 Tax=Trichonephila clavipes TaxID=2585209 RepID=A0A8X6RBU0_TRICX|nr:DDE_3 domain-containing protein [Trichonephila clavipes]
MNNGRTRLHVVANGTMTGQRYIDEVLLPHDCLDSEGIQRLVWPVHSPDLNPIENVWDALGRQVAGRNYPPTNKNTLIRALTEEWDKLPQQLLGNVVQKYSKFCGGYIVSMLDVTKLTHRSSSQEFTTRILAVIKCNISYLFENKKWTRKKLLWIK